MISGGPLKFVISKFDCSIIPGAAQESRSFAAVPAAQCAAAKGTLCKYKESRKVCNLAFILITYYTAHNSDFFVENLKNKLLCLCLLEKSVPTNIIP